MVRPSDLGWFDTHGPMEEFCFSQDGVPLVEPPPYYKAGQQPTIAPAGDRG
jgi:hypothetical protein